MGENIDAKLMTDQAEADKKVAQAQAEKRRALAVAQEQENIARVAENRAKVVLAEAEIPLAIAQAFKSGNLGVMDYYKIRNVQADTDMRESIAGDDKGPPRRPTRVSGRVTTGRLPGPSCRGRTNGRARMTSHADHLGHARQAVKQPRPTLSARILDWLAWKLRGGPAKPAAGPARSRSTRS